MPPSQPTDQKLQHETLVRLRSQGESLTSLALIEDDLITGTFRWANAFFFERTGYTPEQLENLTVFAVMPERFHAELQERLGGKRSKYFVAPFKNTEGRVTWWFAHDVEELYPIHWAQARYLMTTDASGTEFDMMVLLAELTNASGELFRDHETVHEWVRKEITRLDGVDTEIRHDVSALDRAVSAIQGQITQALRASREAANASLRVDDAVKKLAKQHENLETRVSSEILRLIGTDQLYETQFKDFQTQLATATQRATHSIQAAAQDAGKTISFKISFPVGVVGGLAVIINYLLTHPEIIVKVLGLGP